MPPDTQPEEEDFADYAPREYRAKLAKPVDDAAADVEEDFADYAPRELRVAPSQAAGASPAPVQPSNVAPANIAERPGDGWEKRLLDLESGVANGLLFNWGDELEALGLGGKLGNAAYRAMNPGDPAALGTDTVTPLADAQGTTAGQVGQTVGNVVGGAMTGGAGARVGGYLAQGALGGASNVAAGVGAREGIDRVDAGDVALDALLGVGGGMLGHGVGKHMAQKAAAKAAAELDAVRPVVSRVEGAAPTEAYPRQYPAMKPAPAPPSSSTYDLGDLEPIAPPTPRAMRAATPAPAPAPPPAAPAAPPGLELDPSATGARELLDPRQLVPAGRAPSLELNPNATGPALPPSGIDLPTGKPVEAYKRPPKAWGGADAEPGLELAGRKRAINLDPRQSARQPVPQELRDVVTPADAGGTPELSEWLDITRQIDAGPQPSGLRELDMPSNAGRLELEDLAPRVPTPRAPELDLRPRADAELYSPHVPVKPRGPFDGSTHMERPLTTNIPAPVEPVPDYARSVRQPARDVEAIDLPERLPSDDVAPMVVPDDASLVAKATRAEQAREAARRQRDEAPHTAFDWIANGIKNTNIGKVAKFLGEALTTRPAPAVEIEAIRRAQGAASGLREVSEAAVAPGKAQAQSAGPDVPTLTWALQSAGAKGVSLPPAEQQALDSAIMSGDGSRISSAYMRASMRNPAFQKQVIREIERANKGD